MHELVYNCVRSCDADVRPDLFANIVCQGGHARLPGFSHRLEKEIAALVATHEPELTTATSVVGAEEHSAWVGASILASLPGFEPEWITREEYAAQGARLVHRRCYR